MCHYFSHLFVNLIAKQLKTRIPKGFLLPLVQPLGGAKNSTGHFQGPRRIF